MYNKISRLKNKTANKDVMNVFSRSVVVLLFLFFITFSFNTFGFLIFAENKSLAFELAELNILNKGNIINLSFNEYEAVLLFIFPFIIGVMVFAFLLNKDRCYSILSMPVKKKSLFNNRFIAPVLIISVIILIIKFIALGIVGDVQGFSKEVIWCFVYNLFACLQNAFTAFFAGAVGCFFSGKLSETVMLGLSILMVPYFAVKLITNVLNETFYGTPDDFRDKAEDFLYSICPVTYNTGAYCHLREGFSNECNYRSFLTIVVWFIITSIAVIFLKKYFVKDFKAENCGFPGYNKKSFAFICFVYSCAFCSFFSIFLFKSEENGDIVTQGDIFVSVLLCVILAFVSSVICGIFISSDIKNIKYMLLSGGSVAAVIIVAAVSGLTNLFGVYNAIPKAENVKNIQVTLPLVLDRADVEYLFDDKYNVTGYIKW